VSGNQSSRATQLAEEVTLQAEATSAAEAGIHFLALVARLKAAPFQRQVKARFDIR